MEVIYSEEFESVVVPLFNKALTNIVTIGKYEHTLVSQRFDYIKVMSNPDGSWFNIEPMVLQQALATTSCLMGDRYIYMSFLGYENIVEADEPLHFKFSTEEFLNEEAFILKGMAEKSAYKYKIFDNVLYYSPQGLWAVTAEMDPYGTIGMTKEFLDIVRGIYPQLDEELERQLLNFVRWCQGLADEWTYSKLGDDEVCTSWCRGWLEYLCRLDITHHFHKMSGDPDLIHIYRNMKV